MKERKFHARLSYMNVLHQNPRGAKWVYSLSVLYNNVYVVWTYKQNTSGFCYCLEKLKNSSGFHTSFTSYPHKHPLVPPRSFYLTVSHLWGSCLPVWCPTHYAMTQVNKQADRAFTLWAKWSTGHRWLFISYGTDLAEKNRYSWTSRNSLPKLVSIF